jgi:hypothetical protein
VTSIPIGIRKDRIPAYFTEEKRMENEWSYKNLSVKEGLKPGSKHFQYFFVVSEGGQKKCNYCVWIEDEALSRFSALKNFKAILDSHRGDWDKWVKEKIDRKDFRNMVLMFDKEGHKEMDLDKMDKKLRME